MQCPKCGYAMDSFDKECPRCHGRGTTGQSSSPQPAASTEPAPPPAPAGYSYSRFCPHCGAGMSIKMQYCPSCHKKNTSPAVPQKAVSKFKASSFFGALLVLLLVGGFLYALWTPSPKYSLWQAQRANDAHDLVSFEKYVDIDGCVDSYLDDTFTGFASQMAGAAQGAAFGQTFFQGLITQMKPALATGLKKQIRDSVEKGDAEKERDAEKLGISVKELEEKAREQGMTYDGIEYVKEDGAIALVGLKFSNQKDESKSFVLELKTRKLGGYWQVTKLNNVVEVFKKFGVFENSLPAKSGSNPVQLPDALVPPVPNVTTRTAPSTATLQRDKENTEYKTAFTTTIQKIASAEKSIAGPDITAGDVEDARDSIHNALTELGQKGMPERFAKAYDLVSKGVAEDDIAFSYIAEGKQKQDPDIVRKGSPHFVNAGEFFSAAGGEFDRVLKQS